MYTELEIVNDVLAGPGYAPVASVDVVHPAVRDAVRQVDLARRELLMKKWWFNHYKTTLPLQPDNRILLPLHTTSVIPTGSSFLLAVVQRDRYLFDLANQTFTFAAPVEAYVTVSTALEDMPPAAQSVVRTVARLRYYIEKGGQAKAQLMDRERVEAFGVFNQEHLQQSKTNWQNSVMGSHKYIVPFNKEWRQE